jgi:hypothetical protein
MPTDDTWDWWTANNAPPPGSGGDSGGGGGRDRGETYTPGEHGDYNTGGIRPFTAGTSGGDPGRVHGIEGGESNPLHWLATPSFADNQGYAYVDPNAFVNQYDEDIREYMYGGLDQRANTNAPMQQGIQLGGAYQGGAAQIAPQMMLGGAQIAPQMMANAAQASTAQDVAYAGAQNTLINDLYAAQQGQGPSVAEEQAKQASEAALAAQMGALGSQRGAGNAALAQRTAAMAGAQAQQQAAATGALGRAQEATAARQMLNTTLAGARGQTQATDQFQAQLQQQALLANQGGFNAASLQQAQLQQQAALANQALTGQVSQAQAQLGQQSTLANQAAMNQFLMTQGQMDQATLNANQQAWLANRGLNEQVYAQMLGQYGQHTQAQVSNQAAFEQMLAQQQQAILSLNAGEAIASGQQTQGLMGAAAAAGGALMMMSDERVKKGVRGGRRQVRSFLEALRVREEA